MKKTIFVILIVALLAIALTACGSKNNVYSKLNGMLDDEFSTVKLKVETTHNGITLVNEYAALSASNGTMITYSVQTLAEIIENEDGTFTMPSEMIITERGNGTVEGDKIIELNGKAENIPVNALQNLGIKFSKDYFIGTIHSENDGVKTILGNVNQDHVKDFTGNRNFDGKDMTFEVIYGETIKSLVINYTMNSGASVKVTYTFA
jgi:hypothetical protein